MVSQHLRLAPEEELLLANVLAECLDAMEEGASDLHAIAARYPSFSARVKPLLEIAQALRQRRPDVPVVTPQYLLDWEREAGRHRRAP